MIKVAAVNYLNTKPLLYGIKHSELRNEIELLLDYPSNLARDLEQDSIDVALLPVAAIPSVPNASIIGDYGIAADGTVASVAIFSEVPMEEINSLYLDYQSRTSVKLAEVLLKNYWKKDIWMLKADENYIEKIRGKTAGVIIGDRALNELKSFPYVYDLSAAWKEMTGLPFVFAAWVANKKLPGSFITAFNEANKEGLAHLDAVIAENPFPAYDLKTYYTENIHYFLDAEKQKGLGLFLSYLSNQ